MLFEQLMQPWQQADFQALDPAWRHLAGFPVQPTFRRAYVERPRGHAKTSDMAMQIAWILQHAQRRIEGMAAAADREQAGLIRDAVFRIVEHNPEFCPDLQFTKHDVTNKQTGSRLSVIASDVKSSFGALPDFVICDELCHWDQPEMWFSLVSSAAKQTHCLLAVLTNAGVGRDWHWDVRENARTNPRWYFSSLQEPQAPWMDAEHLDEQRRILPPPVFDRLWRNIWQHSDGEFVTLAEAQACRDDSLAKRDHGEPGVQYIAAVDYAEKRDYTAAVVVHYEGETVIVDRMDVAVPRPESPVQIQWVEDWVRRISEEFHNVTFVVDEWQLLGMIQRLGSRYPIRRFEFAGQKGNHALAMTLRRLIVHRQIRWYPGCGKIDTEGTGFGNADGESSPPDQSTADTLETELAALLLQQSPTGYCRINHRSDGRHHDDRAFALGAACLHALRERGTQDWMHIAPPTTTGEFNL